MELTFGTRERRRANHRAIIRNPAVFMGPGGCAGLHIVLLSHPSYSG